MQQLSLLLSAFISTSVDSVLHASSDRIMVRTLLLHHRSGAPPTRLHTFWRGPMRVVSGNNSRYKLYDLITHKETTVHTSDMKPFVFDPAVTDLLARRRRTLPYFGLFQRRKCNSRTHEQRDQSSSPSSHL
jgi:hypothetical protein